ncbi:MAG: urease accessory protein [Rhodospirillales bacterium]|nr:urease accessory protein [Rhodospirillales bacterium]
METVADGGLEILLLGLVIGMKHALEADHVAAVSSIAARETSMRRIITDGAVWGVGHTLTLMIVAGGAVVFGLTIGGAVAERLELVVGVMLVGLGGHVVYALARERIHFHRHRHADGTTHFHAHSHKGETSAHDVGRHHHGHPRGLPIRSLLVGMMHGMAGSATLMVLSATTVSSVRLGLGYIVLFGVGSIFGMAALSALIAVPLTWSARALTWANTGLQAAIGSATVVLGCLIIGEHWRSLIGS